jgi:tetratricopeptide (TPR) repeat protein
VQAAEPTSAYWRELTANDAAALAGVQGKLAQAEQQYRAAAAAAEARGVPSDVLAQFASLAQIEVRQRNRPDVALALLSSALARHPLSSMQPTDRPYVMLAATYAIAGRPDEAERLMAEYARVVPPSLLKGNPERLTAAGEIASARGHYAEAIADFRAEREEDGRPGYNLFQMGSAFAKLGQLDSARSHYEHYLERGGLYRVLGDVDLLAATYQRLGEVYEALGNRTKAVEYYVKLIDLWKNADPELQPIVKDAHARVARLSAEH